jgi:hypothetical protein
VDKGGDHLSSDICIIAHNTASVTVPTTPYRQRATAHGKGGGCWRVMEISRNFKNSKNLKNAEPLPPQMSPPEGPHSQSALYHVERLYTHVMLHSCHVHLALAQSIHACLLSSTIYLATPKPAPAKEAGSITFDFRVRPLPSGVAESAKTAGVGAQPLLAVLGVGARVAETVVTLPPHAAEPPSFITKPQPTTHFSLSSKHSLSSSSSKPGPPS